ncbi:MAG TPA: NAD(+) synthase [Blastocatellia bacterium]|nr:NAD(+) synthase [Blastocatellia bacterium]
MRLPFNSIYSHGFVRAAVCTPFLRVADPQFNLEHTLGLARRASELNAAVALFPELGLSAYSNEDLFHQDALLTATEDALVRLVEHSKSLVPILIVGAPLRFERKLFNCAVIVYRGRVLGIVPKTYLPNYREFYEKRQFTSGRNATNRDVVFLDQRIPFGSDLVFDVTNVRGFSLHAEICEDVWVPIPPSTYAALAGATVLANLSASNIIVGKAEYRRDLCASQSGKCIAAYMYSAAGPGESTTDLAWDGHALIYENHELLAEAPRFSSDEHIVAADIDLERLTQDRMRQTSFNDSAYEQRDRLSAIRHIEFEFEVPKGEISLMRRVGRFPYVPQDPASRDNRCYEAYNIQVHGLMKRLVSTSLNHIVIGVSGGLDSTHALIVAAKTMDRLGLPRKNILAYTMPGFATSDVTLKNAHALINALGVSGGEIDIRPSCMQMFADIGHPFSKGEPVYDITFENVQAGERTSHLFRLANLHDGIVLGTSDLSELALGWTTYGVGDHMSHYAVNASVPKTLIQYLIRWVISSRQFEQDTASILQSIVDTEISPELVPAGDKRDKPSQSTQEKIGPYELQDFNIYYVTRYGYRPSKVAFLSHNAWADKTRGDWPDAMPAESRNEYDLPTIKKWLEVFLYRFFQISQFKRSCIPNAPKVGSGGSLSPRGDWRAPSDSEAIVWLNELRQNVPD